MSDKYIELLSQITHPKKLLFLQEYPKFCVATKTCLAIGAHETTFYDWRDTDGDFNQAFLALKKDIEHALIERHEKNIDDVAFAEKTPPQSRIFGSLVKLRALAPEKYREKFEAKTGDINVVVVYEGEERTLRASTVSTNALLELKGSKHTERNTDAIQGQGETEGSGITGSQA